MMVYIEAFPGQGKKYDHPNPQGALLNDLLRGHDRFQQLGIQPDYVYGHSFGLYAGMVAAGATSRDEAIRLANVRTQIVRETETKSPNGPSEMWSLIGVGREVAEKIAASLGIDLSNDNGPLLQVLAGYAHFRSLVEQKAQEFGVRKMITIPTGGAFHTKTVRAGDREEYAKEVFQTAKISDAKIPLITSTRPRIIQAAVDIKNELVDQITEMVEVPEVVRLFDGGEFANFIDVSGGELMKIFDRVKGNFKMFALEKDFRQIQLLVGNR